ncbi:prolyl oligopeptidase family serine peptidase [Xinfangfangia sp. D13-10-4-6]|uniref:alpha/beta hydrolase n=1 Tax=Pseudogemmobacter hezensis TaxID=2737662 RepID=UPI0015524112|nr:prolyl oligopeptidase family serine peptidase [Pseudogemmobacter hezensis]NPD14852.1 prolyl oligopeptidase family serine peptidase [Pseudogemmobacter hezensis]
MSVSLVIMLHGVGSRGADLAGLAPLLQPSLPGAAFEAPDAPLPFDMGGPGRQWFSVAGVTQANRAARIQAARPGFDQVIGDLIARHGLTDQPQKVAFLGFSQGTIMALDALASGRWQPGAIVGFSGRLATPDPLSPAPQTRVLLVHGEADSVIPAQDSAQALDRLQAAGAQAELKLLPGLGHTISREGLALAASHLAGR